MRPRRAQWRQQCLMRQLTEELEGWVREQANQHGTAEAREARFRDAIFQAYREGLSMRRVMFVSKVVRELAIERSQLTETEAAALGPGMVKALRKVWLGMQDGLG